MVPRFAVKTAKMKVWTDLPVKKELDDTDRFLVSPFASCSLIKVTKAVLMAAHLHSSNRFAADFSLICHWKRKLIYSDFCPYFCF